MNNNLALYLEKVQGHSAVEGSIMAVQRAFLSNLLMQHPDIVRIGETGFNVGISAATFLSTRSDILVTSFDWLCYPGYNVYPLALDAQRELNKLFPRRHTLIAGDSLETVPAFGAWLDWRACFDLVFIDGGHVWPTPYADIINLFMLLEPGGFIVVDDYCPAYGQDGVIRAWDTLCAYGVVATERPYGGMSDGNRGWVVGRKINELDASVMEE